MKANCISIFDKWLQSNAQRFNGHEPILARRIEKRAAVYLFKGVTKHIKLVVQRAGGCVVTVNRKRVNIDLIYDIGIYPERTESGRYFCSMCISRHYYRSMNQLFINQACEPLIEWTNQTFVESNQLMMVRMNGASWAKVLAPRALRLKTNRRRSDHSVYELVNVIADSKHKFSVKKSTRSPRKYAKK